MKKAIASLALCAAMLASLTACGNAGANTTCKDFNNLKSDGQTDVIKQIYKDKGESNAGALKVTAYKLSAKAYCQVKSSDSKLSGMSGS